MSGPSIYFTADHRACDDLWGELEAALDAGDKAKAGALWSRFDRAMRRHFDMEENELFPALEEATGMRGFGPVVIMREEHIQMRAALDRMAHAAESEDLELLADEGDTLLMLIQQHNIKEEGVLYPMADQHLDGRWADLVGRLSRY